MYFPAPLAEQPGSNNTPEAMNTPWFLNITHSPLTGARTFWRNSQYLAWGRETVSLGHLVCHKIQKCPKNNGDMLKRH